MRARPLIAAACALGAASAFGTVRIEPDYAGIVVPPNVAPLNFDVRGLPPGAGTVRVELVGTNGAALACAGAAARFGEADWREFLRACGRGGAYEIRVTANGATRFCATNRVSEHAIDSHLVYRLVPPGYSCFDDLGIYERDLTTFAERALYRNVQVGREQCVNCHTFNRADPKTYMFHTRALHAGTQIVSAKYGAFKRDVRTDGEKPFKAVYPAWHPSGDWIAFGAGDTFQMFYEASDTLIEVADHRAALILHSVRDGSTRVISADPEYLECFPAFSADGRTLWGVRARKPHAEWGKDGLAAVEASVTNLLFDLVRRTFDPATGACSDPETVAEARALGSSFAFPRPSPDGRWVVFTAAPYGGFPIWHRASDLAIADLKMRWVRPIGELNSGEAESYHTFSSDGTWLVFSSRRGDGAYTRPYFAHFDAKRGRFSKPFLLPVRDPGEHDRRMLSYNVPEFSAGPVAESARELRALVTKGVGK